MIGRVLFVVLACALAGCSGREPVQSPCNFPADQQGLVGRALSYCDDEPCPCHPFDLVLRVKAIEARLTTSEQARQVYADATQPGQVVTSSAGAFLLPLPPGSYVVYWEGEAPSNLLPDWGRPRAVAELDVGAGRAVHLTCLLGGSELASFSIESLDANAGYLNWE